MSRKRTYSGNLSVRTTPEIHKMLANYADRKGFTLGQYVEAAILNQFNWDDRLFP